MGTVLLKNRLLFILPSPLAGEEKGEGVDEEAKHLLGKKT
jgi:hypothetical protein